MLSGGTTLSQTPGNANSSTAMSATSSGIAQLGIAFGALGVVLAFMGLFPGVTGISPARGMGAVQFVAVFLGVSLLHLAALVYVKFSFYARQAATFAQQIGVRLVWTGLLFIAIFGLADFVGFGSQPPVQGDSYFGPLQAIGVVGSLVMAGTGVLVYAWGGLSAGKDGEAG